MCPLLNGSSLSLEEVVAVAGRKERAELAPDARAHMVATRAVVDEALARNDTVYGLTTALAERKRVRPAPQDRRAFNHMVIRSHRIAQLPAAPEPVVRAAVVSLANSLAKGYAGVRPDLVEMLLAGLDRPEMPVVRALGSVGQADLGPMSDLAYGLLESSGFELAENEGVALLNNNALSTGWAAMAVAGASRLLDTLDVAAALDLEGFVANPSPLHPAIAGSRPSPGLAATLGRLHELLEGSSILDDGAARNLQDPLTFRCVPQIHGAVRDVLTTATEVVERALNSAQGNPMVVLEERRIVSVGNFDSLPVSSTLDFVRIALASALMAASERALKLLQAPLSGLPAGLAAAPETGEDALAEFAVTVQSLAVEAKLLAQPVSFELSSTSKGEAIEDRTTMTPTSARKLDEMVALGARILAIELMVSCQAIDLRTGARLGRGTGLAYERLRRLLPFAGAGQDPPFDLEGVVEAVAAGGFSG